MTSHLLLVEDDPDNLEILRIILSEKYRVSSYGCAAEAMTAVEGEKPDLLVLDITMTPIDGLDCLKAIRARPGYDSIPALALTALAREVEREALFAAGFQGVVTKPILEDQDLFAAVDQALAAVAVPSCNLQSGATACNAECVPGPELTASIDDGDTCRRERETEHPFRPA